MKLSPSLLENLQDEELTWLLQQTSDWLRRSAHNGTLATALEQVLGLDPRAAVSTAQDILASLNRSPTRKSGWALPDVQVASAAAIAGAAAAYVAERNLILLNQEFLAGASDTEVIQVLLEEVGHSLDARFNNADTPGDEGERFALILLGGTSPFGSFEQAAYDAAAFEDDTITVTLDGTSYTAEAATINGTGGNDTLNGGVGIIEKDTLNGGLGNDQYIADYFDTITEATAGGTDTVIYRNYTAYKDAAYYLPTNVENLQARFLTAPSGAETIVGAAGRAILVGNALANSITGSSLDDVLRTDGSTTINGNTTASPRDTLVGGLGNDEYQVINSNAVITETSVTGGGTADVVFYLGEFYGAAGGTAVKTFVLPLNVEEGRLNPSRALSGITLKGNASNNIMVGDTATNTLDGGTGNDTLIGGPNGSTADVYLGVAGDGSDRILYVDTGFARAPLSIAPLAAATLSTFSTFSATTTSSTTASGDITNKPGQGKGNTTVGVKNGYVTAPPSGTYDTYTGFESVDVIDLGFMPNTAPGYWPKTILDSSGNSIPNPWQPRIYFASSESDYPTAEELNAGGFNLYFSSYSGALIAVYDIAGPDGQGPPDRVPIAIITAAGNKGFSLTEANFLFTGTAALTSASPTALNALPRINLASGSDTGVVKEDVTLTASNTLIVSDSEDAITDNLTWSVLGSSAGVYGAISVSKDANGNGVWQYTLNNSSNAVQELGEGVTKTDVFTVQVTDGSDRPSNTVPITITVTGTNDAAIISGAASGTVVEGGLPNTVTGDLLATDVDGTADAFRTVANTATTSGYGSYQVSAAGVWTYTLNAANATVKALTSNQELNDTFTVLSEDGTPQMVKITILGTSDPVIFDLVSDTFITSGITSGPSNSKTAEITDRTTGQKLSAVVSTPGSGTVNVSSDGIGVDNNIFENSDNITVDPLGSAEIKWIDLNFKGTGNQSFSPGESINYTLSGFAANGDPVVVSSPITINSSQIANDAFRVNLPAGMVSIDRLTLVAGATTSVKMTFSIAAITDSLLGTSGPDTITGVAIAEYVNGNAGNDSINGGAGNDTIRGGLGSDAITGGDGVDRFVYRQGDGASLAPNALVDTYTDFASTERIQILAASGSTVKSATIAADSSTTINDYTITAVFNNGTTDTTEFYRLVLSNSTPILDNSFLV